MIHFGVASIGGLFWGEFGFLSRSQSVLREDRESIASFPVVIVGRSSLSLYFDWLV